MTCPPTNCPHPILLPGNCCPTCLNVGVSGCLKGNQSTTLPNNFCLHSGNVYQNGDTWPLIENNIEHMEGEHPRRLSLQRGGCTSCKCKVFIHSCLAKLLPTVHRSVKIELLCPYRISYI